jgi:hypothetical protein
MDGVARFVKVQRDHDRVMLIVGVVMFAAAVGSVIALPADVPAARFGVAAIFVVLGGLCVAKGATKPDNRPGIVALRDTPQDIVWCYSVTEYKNGRATGASMTVGMVSGKLLSLPIELGKESEFEAIVVGLAPGIPCGFSDELSAKFKRDPKSLRA